jgi:periplasmic copper chaperone A
MQESGTRRHGSKTMTARTLWMSLFLALGTVFPGAAPAQGIQVVDAWSRPTPPGTEVGVAYFTIRNGGKSDRLLSASSPVAKRADLHVSSVKDGVTKMQHLSEVAVGGGTSTSFEPNGRHVMLTGLRRPLKQGEVFPLTLTFANAGPVETRVRVRGADDPGIGNGMDHSRIRH